MASEREIERARLGKFHLRCNRYSMHDLNEEWLQGEYARL